MKVKGWKGAECGDPRVSNVIKNHTIAMLDDGTFCLKCGLNFPLDFEHAEDCEDRTACGLADELINQMFRTMDNLVQ